MSELNQLRKSETYVARPISTREARQFVGEWLTQQRLDRFAARATLSVSELAANAVLHTAQPFTVSVQGSDGRARVEVVDSAPGLVPMRVPTQGTAVDLTSFSETGRGLQIVSAVANRWGIALAPNVKTVWCEFDGPDPSAPSDPVVDDARPTAPRVGNAYRLQFLSLPVRVAIASGLDVEEAIRDLQTDDARASSAETAELLNLVDRTASIRLAGRHAALSASSRHEQRYDLEIETTDEEMAAVAQLNVALSERRRRGPSAQVTAFRAWLVEETARQRNGEAPTPFAETH